MPQKSSKLADVPSVASQLPCSIKDPLMDAGSTTPMWAYSKERHTVVALAVRPCMEKYNAAIMLFMPSAFSKRKRLHCAERMAHVLPAFVMQWAVALLAMQLLLN